jgi:hypothetical protein
MRAQVQAVASSGTSATAYTGVGQAAAKIFREEGFLAFWKGNGVNIIRIFPYSAAQLAANDSYKRLLAGGFLREVCGSGRGFRGRAIRDTFPYSAAQLEAPAG